MTPTIESLPSSALPRPPTSQAVAHTGTLDILWHRLNRFDCPSCFVLALLCVDSSMFLRCVFLAVDILFCYPATTPGPFLTQHSKPSPSPF